MGAIGTEERYREDGHREDRLRDRIVAATLVCIARWGVAKTTLEDVAREAGCGRATIYRTFAGGKREVLRAVVASEAARFRAEVDGAIAGVRDVAVGDIAVGDRAVRDTAVRDTADLTETVVAGVVAAARFLGAHEALHYLLAHEPDLVLPWVGFHRLGALFDLVGEFAAPHLSPFVADDDEARRAAEWLARVVLTYVLNPSDGLDLADPAAARHLLCTYVIPGLTRATHPASHPTPHPAPQEDPCPAPTSR